MPLFCGEDLNFGAFSKYFSLGNNVLKAYLSYETRDNLNKSGMLSDGTWATDAVI
jgi:hypothetical protein